MSKITTCFVGGVLFALLLLNGCESKNDENAKSHLDVKGVEKTQKIDFDEVLKEGYKEVDLSDVFKDTAKIAPDGKYMVIIFDSKNCKYCKKLRVDIAQNQKLKEKLKNSFSSYSLDVGINRVHKLFHNSKLMDVDTKTLANIYRIEATPTIIFSDKAAKTILVVPGYMPPKQFLVTLEFIEKGLWLDKDRKNGEVYEVLKKFYIDKGILREKK